MGMILRNCTNTKKCNPMQGTDIPLLVIKYRTFSRYFILPLPFCFRRTRNNIIVLPNVTTSVF